MQPCELQKETTDGGREREKTNKKVRKENEKSCVFGIGLMRSKIIDASIFPILFEFDILEKQPKYDKEIH